MTPGFWLRSACCYCNGAVRSPQILGEEVEGGVMGGKADRLREVEEQLEAEAAAAAKKAAGAGKSKKSKKKKGGKKKGSGGSKGEEL
jgi:hypothetical protein